MLPRRPFLALASLAALLGTTRAVSLEFTRVSSSSSSSFRIADSEKDQDSDDEFGYQNSQNASGSDIYVATLGLLNKSFVVQLDTGSSDLWLDTSGLDLSSLTSTGVTTGLTYGDETVAQGPVYVGNITLGDFSVNTAFISAPGTNATTNGDTGLLGVGPPSLSSITQALANTAYSSFANTLLGSIFAANSSLPEYITFTLSRSFATGKTDGGVFTIGEIPSNYSAVNSAPKNNVVSSDRWIVLLNGIIVNGQNVSGGSAFEVTGQSSSQTLANLDTGTSLAQVPLRYAQVIYGSIPGSQYVSDSGTYIVPCSAAINLTFVFSGVEYPVHPIDTVAATTDNAGNVICYSGFGVGQSNSEDFLLGDSFLRNVFALYDYGAFFNESSTPYVQLLSTTSADQAYSQFNTLSQQRNQTLKGSSNSSSSSSVALLPPLPWSGMLLVAATAVGLANVGGILV